MATAVAPVSRPKSTGHTLIRLPCFIAMVALWAVGIPMTEWLFPEDSGFRSLTYLLLGHGTLYLLMRIAYHTVSDNLPQIQRHLSGMRFYAGASFVLLLVGMTVGPGVLAPYEEEFSNLFRVIVLASSFACLVLNYGHHFRGHRRAMRREEKRLSAEND